MSTQEPVSPRFPIATIGPRTLSSSRPISELFAVPKERPAQMSAEPARTNIPSAQTPRDRAA
jgi:hypothetical protein